MQIKLMYNPLYKQQNFWGEVELDVEESVSRVEKGKHQYKLKYFFPSCHCTIRLWLEQVSF